MSDQTPVSAPQPNATVAEQSKSAVVAVLLTFLFGPLGLLYVSVPASLIMLVATFLLGTLTFGIGALLAWPICMIWAGVAAAARPKAA